MNLKSNLNLTKIEQAIGSDNHSFFSLSGLVYVKVTNSLDSSLNLYFIYRDTFLTGSRKFEKKMGIVQSHRLYS